MLLSQNKIKNQRTHIMSNKKHLLFFSKQSKKKYYLQYEKCGSHSAKASRS